MSDGRFPKGNIPWNKGKQHNPKNENTRFKKGLVPHNTRDLGVEYVDPEGYTYIKVASHSVWKLKSRLLYEWYTGEVLTKNDSILFLDGDLNNFRPGNLIRVTRSELATLCKLQIKSYPAELRLTLIYYVTLCNLIRKLGDTPLS